MMAASLVGTGSGASVDSHPPIPSSTHSPSLHEPSSTATSTTASNASDLANGEEESEEGGLESDTNSLSLAGRKLAVSSTPGLSASESTPESLPVVQEDEKKIALSQLQELEVAIEVRKVTKVDGRKTRWIEYRRQRRASNLEKQQRKRKRKPFDDGQMAKALIDLKTHNKNLDELNRKEKKSVKQSNFKVKQLKKFIRSQPHRIESALINVFSQNGQISEIDDVNNDTNNNNSNIKLPSMKAELTITNNLTSGPGTTTVLETMKQQFLEDTSKAVNKALIISKSKAKKKKLTKPIKSLSSSPVLTNGKFKRKARGRPKKMKLSKISKKSNALSKPKVPVDCPTLNNGEAKIVPEVLSAPKKSENVQGISQSTTEFYSRRNTLTKGLREVRKSESGSDSGGSSPLKASSPLLPLAISPLPLSPIPSDSGSVGPYTKCPLITAAAKALSTNSRQVSENSKRKGLKKNTKREPSNKIQKVVNGHTSSMTNGSCKFLNDDASQKEFSSKSPTTFKAGGEGKTLIKKRPRGRPRSNDGVNSFKWSKKTSTIIADVHNTMNGEPQMVIPVNNPVVASRKKKSSPLRSHKASTNDFNSKEIKGISEVKPNVLDSTSNKENSYLPTVPDDPCSLSLVNSPSKLSKRSSSSSASRINDILIESGYTGSTKDYSNVGPSKVGDVIKTEKVPELQNDEIIIPDQNLGNLEKSSDVPRGICSSETLLERDKESLNSIPYRKSLSPPKEFDKTHSNNALSLLTTSTSPCVDSAAPETSKRKSVDPRQRTILEFAKPINLAPKVSNSLPEDLKNSPMHLGEITKDDTPANHICIDSMQENCHTQSMEALHPTSTNAPSLNNGNSTPILDAQAKLELPESSEEYILPSHDKNESFKLKKTPTKLPKGKSLNAVIKKLHSPTSKKLSLIESSHKKIMQELTDQVASNVPYIKEESIDEFSSSLQPESIDSQQQSTIDSHPKPVVTKVKDKVPRFLRQLFEDEGVQNMLRSMNEDNSNNEGSTNSDSATHKLRPKRANESTLSDSPEPDESLLSQSHKRKKRGNEIENLLIDEGSLNLLSGLDPPRKPSADDGIGEGPRMGAKSSLLSSKPLDTLDADSRKRKLSGTNANVKLQPQENKNPKVSLIEPISQDKTSNNDDTSTKLGEKCVQKSNDRDLLKKKPSRPSLPTVPIRQKSKLQLQMVKKRMQTLGIKENMTVSQIKELLEKRKKAALNFQTSKGIPTLKIKLCPNIKYKEKDATIGHDATSSSTLENASFSKPVHSNPCLKPNALVHSCPSESSLSITSLNESTQKERGNVPALLSKPIKRPPSGSSDSPPITSLVHSLEASINLQKGKPRITGEGLRQSQRSSVRQSEGNYHYRDIQLRKYNSFMQIILTPSTTKMKNALNSRVLHELCEALSTIRRDDSVRMVLLTATGSTFCQGVDLTSLQHPNQDTRKKNAENLLRGIRDFLRALVQFPKMIVAGVNGNAMGLGVTMLPLFDLVIATDKAEFYLPYGKLGQVPEGGATYTFPYFFGKLQSTKLFLGHKITATEATQIGLASETLWPATFLQELIPKVATLASQSVQSMEATKALMNHHLITKLELSVESECRLLLQHWMSPTFSTLCKRFLDSHHIQLQKPVNLPL